MNKYVIPLVILLGSLLFAWCFKTCRQPECKNCQAQHQCCKAKTSVAPVVVADTTHKAVAIADTVKKVVTPEEKLLFKPIDMYFPKGGTVILHNAELDNFLVTAKRYLGKNPDAKLSLVGHTDSDGADANNLALSIKRAQIAKSLLVKDGFKAVNLISSGRGEKVPKVPNTTPANKSKNRRVSISLMK